MCLYGRLRGLRSLLFHLILSLRFSKQKNLPHVAGGCKLKFGFIAIYAYLSLCSYLSVMEGWSQTSDGPKY